MGTKRSTCVTILASLLLHAFNRRTGRIACWEISHRLMRGLGEPWTTRLDGIRAVSPVESPTFYYDLLAPHAERVNIWQTTYEHVMPDIASIVEWVKGTGIRPYLEALTPDERAAYLADYTKALEIAYPSRAAPQPS